MNRSFRSKSELLSWTIFTINGPSNHWNMQSISTGVLDKNSTKTHFTERDGKGVKLSENEELIPQSTVYIVAEHDLSRLFLHPRQQRTRIVQQLRHRHLRKRRYKQHPLDGITLPSLRKYSNMQGKENPMVFLPHFQLHRRCLKQQITFFLSWQRLRKQET